MKAADLGPDEHDLNEALRALARAERAQAPPPHVEDAVMGRWSSARRRRTVWGRFTLPRTPVLAAASSLMLALAVSGGWVLGRVEPPVGGPKQTEMAGASAWHSDDMLAWLDPNPDSLQIVRLRVASEALRNQGYVVSDPDGDGTVEIEMVLGADGMARSVLVTSAETPLN